MSLKVSAAVYSHIGHRPNNEDNFYYNGVHMAREQMNKGGKIHSVCADTPQLYAVCDGMGGAELGEEASLLAVQRLKGYQKSCPHPDSSAYLNALIADTSRAVDDIALKRGLNSGDCGSTIALLILHDWYYRTVHVGDSRVYLLRRGTLTRLTRDDSEVQMMVDEGRITPEEAFTHPLKNVITKHLGMPMEKGASLEPTVGIRKDLMPGDRFLICSDGLSDQVREEDIARTLIETAAPAEAVTALAQQALRAADEGGFSSDNITVLVANVMKIGEKNADKRRIARLTGVKWLLILLSAALAAGAGLAIYDLIKLLTR